MRFAPLADRRGDCATRRRSGASTPLRLQQAIEREAWDGDWYRRGYFDDGTPLGSVSSDECRIDSIAQSWAVISGAADPERARARDVGGRRRSSSAAATGWCCCSPRPSIARALDPGYIKAYPPGIRENGGQYTHAAMWSTLAFAHARGRRSRGRAVFAAQPHQPRQHARGYPSLQSRALRRLRRCVLGARARRARRLDLVHGFGGLDVSNRDRRHPRHHIAGRGSSDQSLHTPCLAGIRDHLQARLFALPHRGREPAGREPGNRSGLARRTRDTGHALRYRLTDDGMYHYVRITLG